MAIGGLVGLVGFSLVWFVLFCFVAFNNCYFPHPMPLSARVASCLAGSNIEPEGKQIRRIGAAQPG